MNARPVYLHGAATSVGWGDSRRSLTDMIFATVTDALRQSDAHMDAVASVVIAAHDLIDGRSLSSMVTAPAAGSYLKDEMRVDEDGLVAASFAAARIEAGEARLSVVAAWGRASEGAPDSVSRVGFDPAFEKPLGLQELDISAVRLSAWLARYGDPGDSRAAATAARSMRAGRSPRALRVPSRDSVLAYPLRQAEGPKWADIVVAMIIGAAPSPVRVGGVGHATDLPRPGERDLVGMPALRQSAEMALRGSARGIDSIDLFEIDGMTLVEEALALESLGLAAPGHAFEHYALAENVNRAGGSAAAWCYPAMGLMRLAECFHQLSGTAGATQLDTAPRRAMAIGSSPLGAQTHTAVVLERA